MATDASFRQVIFFFKGETTQIVSRKRRTTMPPIILLSLDEENSNIPFLVGDLFGGALIPCLPSYANITLEDCRLREKTQLTHLLY